MKVYLISDTHFNHAKIATYCDRPSNFTDVIIRNWNLIVKPDDCVIHLGDVFIGKHEGWDIIYPQLPGRKLLVMGNHDRKRSPTWWMEHGFDAACTAMSFRNAWLTHEPAIGYLPDHCNINIHGHLHNIWHGFHRQSEDGSTENRIAREQKLVHPHQRLFAVEYTNYMPVEFDKFVSHPDKYQARGPHSIQVPSIIIP